MEQAALALLAIIAALLLGVGPWAVARVGARREGKAVASPDLVPELAPDVSEHPAWSIKPQPCPEPPFMDALRVVLGVGAKLRRCSACDSPATEFSFGDWTFNAGEAFIEVGESCSECDAPVREYHVSPDLLAAIQAMYAWEQGETAIAAGTLMEANAEDLRDLDGPSQ